jgi:hypothetical protein
MTKVVAVCTAAIAMLAWPGSLAAHHSLVQFDTTTPVWVKGTVVRFDRVNPHSRIFVDQMKPDGQMERWAVDGPGPNPLTRMGIGEDFLHVGDVIEVCGFVLKEGGVFHPPQPPASAPALSARPISGHLLVMPDGKRRFWSDYGVIEKCLKAGENKETLRREAFAGQTRKLP